jgi:ribosomal protein S18 acetylase RimI-like enzyme
LNVPPSSSIEITGFAEADRAALIGLWQLCGLTRPWNDPSKDIDRKLTDPVGRLLVAKCVGAVIGSVMYGYDGHRGSINYLAVHPDHQGTGLGRRLMQDAEAELLALGCPKINRLVRTDNAAAAQFYEKLSYRQDDVVMLGKRLIPDA